VAEVRRALVEHQILIFPRQTLSPEQHIEFASQFGVPEIHPTREDAADHPEIFIIDTADGAPTAEWWHTDMTALPAPPLGSILHMQISPESGGDTEWASQTAAYEHLPRDVQERIQGLRAVHKAWWDPEMQSVHPVVRKHPESGLRSLFVNGIFTQRILELSETESDDLLQYLYAHSTQERFTHRHAWQAGDVAFWDNRSTQHRVENDFGEARRRIHRVTLTGDIPQ
jgi:taurine dioxygenase